jgi:DNA-directed RNA polymerase beta' subunit
MNAHIPQSYEASIELEELAAVPHQLITPRDAKPIIGIVQDTLVGVYRITRPGTEFNKREFMNMMMWNKRFDGTLPQTDNNKYSGQHVVSELLPPINIEMQNSSENMVRIREGHVQEGVMDKGIFAKPSKGIIHVTYNDYGPQTAVDLIDNMQNTMESYLVLNGFSVGISDLIADEQTKARMEEEIQKRKKEIGDIMLQVHLDLFDNNTGQTNQQAFEDRVFKVLNQATDESGKIGQSSLADENRMTAMVRSGSKGGPINIAQMMACVGQQNIEGKRIPYGFTDRTLPHYKKYDDGPEARGFVESSFINGLTPQEFFYHSMSGREGLIDTAVKTADTGYIQRQMVKALEDLVVQHDGTVRDANMGIVQFHYGEDGVNATKIESQSYPIGKLTEEDIRRDFSMKDVDFTQILEGDNEMDAAAMAKYVEEILVDQRMLVEGVFGSGHQGGVYSPVNIERLILNLRIRFGLNISNKTDLTPAYVLKGLQNVIARTQPFNTMWCALLRFMLAPHKLIVKERFTRAAFDTLCEMLIIKNWQSWVQPGEQVGILAAQSIGEPSTQMTLNSVDWDERIIIAKDGKIITPQIGELIDTMLENADKKDIQHHPNAQLYLPINGNWSALSTDENGKMMWTKLEAVTRHPVINEDGTDTILEVELESGRKVKATKGKSFLTLIDDKITDINGSELKVGDVLPIAMNLDIKNVGEISTFNLRDILPPSNWIYGSEVGKAISLMNSGDRHWFKENNGKQFTVPYSRSDALRDAVNGRNSNEFKEGCVYPKRTRTDTSHIPEEIELTNDFGFFIGAYLAEGMSNSTQINITNNDKQYFDKIINILNEWNVGYHIVSENKECTKTNIKGRTTSLVIHSTLLAKVFGDQFGNKSYVKTMPDWVFQAPDGFVKGLVDGYISGDGTVSKRDSVISATSVSEDLLIRLGTLLARFGIFTKLSSRMPEKKNFNSVSRYYTLTIPVKHSQIFANTFTLTIAEKQNNLNKLLNGYSRSSKREDFNDMIMDKIKSIKEVTPIRGWVYDLTVEKTRNFTLLNALAVKDTFHLAGVASKSNVTRGVPRLKELLKVTKNPKAISLNAPMRAEYVLNKEKAREVAQDLELTLLRDIVTRVAIYYDPDDKTTVLEQDRELLDFYKAFEMSVEGEENNAKWSNLLLRIELDREKMFNKNITMSDIAFVLNNYFKDEINLVYSDYNDKSLVMRIRVSLKVLGGMTAVEDYLAYFKKLQNRLLTGIVVRGIPGIISASFRKDTDRHEKIAGAYKTKEQYIVETDGSNYIEVMNHPALDGTRIYSTHPHDVYDILGVEAARNVLLNEMTTLFNEVGLNYRHLGLLCDMMTRTGKFMSIDRYGINKSNIGPLAKASFEETAKILLKASLFGEMDPVTGVSSNIMMGQAIRGGTSFSQILLDEAALPRLLQGVSIDEEVDETEAEVLARLNVEEVDDPCSAAHFNMNITMPVANMTIDEPDMVMAVYDE